MVTSVTVTSTGANGGSAIEEIYLYAYNYDIQLVSFLPNQVVALAQCCALNEINGKLSVYTETQQVCVVNTLKPVTSRVVQVILKENVLIIPHTTQYA